MSVPSQVDLKTHKNNTAVRGGRLLSIIEESAPELLNGFRGDYAKSLEQALNLRIEDLKEQSVQTREGNAHLEIVSKVAVLREVVATIQYARM